MKKQILPLIILLFASYYCHAQWFPLDPVRSFHYDNYDAGLKQMLIIDSSLFCIRSGGLEELNTEQHTTRYFWNNYYKVMDIVKDTGDTYVYLKNEDFIGRFNQTSQQYENIWPGVITKYFKDVDVSPDGNVWTVTHYGSLDEVGRYDGTNWTFYPCSQSYIFRGLHVINDTLACVSDYNGVFYFFHQGVFDSVYRYSTNYIQDWDVDMAGNIWIAATNELIHFYNGTETIYNATNTPSGTEKFLHVKIGTNGDIWTAGDKQLLFKFDGSSWHTINLTMGAYVENFILNAQNQPWVVSSSNLMPKLMKYNGNTWQNQEFPFQPVRDLKATAIYNNGNGFAFATPEGIFYVNSFNLNFYSFQDTILSPYVNEINCFMHNAPYTVYGTNHGLMGIPGFNNAVLPNDTVNTACYDNGTYYVGTNQGLFTYNGILSSTFNISNSPLPSNKITFVTTANLDVYDNSNALYVGTDKGLAIYKNFAWKVYDVNNLPLSSFYVTGAVASRTDTGIYFSTLGSGLVEVYPQGSYTIYNTSGGNLEDDSLYYVKNMELAECGSFLVMGTAHHGIAFSSQWMMSPNFYYDTTDNYSIPFHNSKVVATSPGWGPNIIGTDSMFYILAPCAGIAGHAPKQELTWQQSGGSLIIMVPDDITGKGSFLLTDMSGRTLIEKDYNSIEKKINLDVSRFASGVYVFRLIAGNKTAYARVSLMKE